MTTKKQADQLWSSLSSALVKAGDAIQKIVQAHLDLTNRELGFMLHRTGNAVKLRKRRILT